MNNNNKYMYKQLFDTHAGLVGKDLKAFIADNIELEAIMSDDYKASLQRYYKLAGYVRLVGGRWELVDGKHTAYTRGKHCFFIKNKNGGKTVEVDASKIIILYTDKLDS